MNPRRGHVYRMHDESYGTLFCLTLPTLYGQLHGSCLAVRVSVTQETRDFPGWVRLTAGDPAFGYVVTQDIDRVGHDELKEDLGPLSVATMLQTEQTLKRVLGL